MSINCCHIALVLAGIILPIVIVLSGRTLKAEARVTKLEKKRWQRTKANQRTQTRSWEIKERRSAWIISEKADKKY